MHFQREDNIRNELIVQELTGVGLCVGCSVGCWKRFGWSVQSYLSELSATPQKANHTYPSRPCCGNIGRTDIKLQ